MASDDEQAKLFDTETKAINPYWIDPNQPLLVPKNPLHFKAHRLQILLAQLDRQVQKNPAQFNSTTYLSVLNDFTKCVQMINEGKSADDLLDEAEVDSVGVEATPPADSDFEPISMDA